MLKLAEKSRNLASTDFGISEPKKGSDYGRTIGSPGGAVALSDDDEILIRAVELIDDGFAGVIFSGPPGTGKSWYAREIAQHITGGGADDIFFVQFHPGYQYEDFVEGYSPTPSGSFQRERRTFLKACDQAASTKKKTVIVIDELSRTDVIRVFGEALTYLEVSKRNLPIRLSSGSSLVIPENLIILATMNPWDRGVDELDLAFERRFAKIEMGPSVEILKQLIDSSELGEHIKARLVQFFYITSSHKNPLCRIGHAYFENAKTESALRRLWDNQLRFHFSKILRHDEDEFKNMESAWKRIFEAG